MTDTRSSHLINTEGHITHVTAAGPSTVPALTGDVDLLSADTGRLEVHMEGLLCAALCRGLLSTDRSLFASEIWKPDLSTGLLMVQIVDLRESIELTNVYERMTTWYQRQWYKNIPREDVTELHHQRLWRYLDPQVLALEAATHPLAHPK
jgi:hypothetical protein